MPKAIRFHQPGGPENLERLTAHMLLHRVWPIGADDVILHAREDFVASVRRLTDGRGVDVVYDGVGGDTLIRSLDCVRPFGMIVSLGQASGSLPEITLTDLGPRRSIAIARPSVITYADDQSAYRAAATVLFDFLADGLKITVGAEFPLAQATEAHRALERSATVGSILLNLS